MSQNEIYPELTHTFQLPQGRESLAEANADLIRIVTKVLDILPEGQPTAQIPDLPGGNLTYQKLDARLWRARSWNGSMVYYQQPLEGHTKLMDDLRGYQEQFTVIRLFDSDYENVAEIFVYSQPPHGAKQWRVRLGYDVVCLDQVVAMDGFHPTRPVFTFDDLLTPEQRRNRDILRQYCFWNT